MNVIRTLLWPLRWLAGIVTRGMRKAEDLGARYGLFFAVSGLLALFLFICFFQRIVIFVNVGEAAVHFRRFHGTEIDRVYGEGVHVIPPWDRMEIYNVRIQEIDQTSTVLTTNGMDVTFNLSIRYRPEYAMLGLLHQKIGKDYLKTIVIPEVEGVLRTQIGHFSAEEVYTTKRGILERIFIEAIAQAEENYVVIDDVVIRSIELPASISKAVEAKEEQKQAADAYTHLLRKEQSEAKRRKIEAEGHSAYNEIISESITEDILRWKGIEATKELSQSQNSKVIVIGNGDKNLPVILGGGEK
jgi:regulator of protease activity HflC (stomatin/prohibitin superfamily)